MVIRRCLKLFFMRILFKNIINNTFNVTSLPAQMHTFLVRPFMVRVRTILNTSINHASLTLEAALTLPFFTLILLGFMYFINILGFQTVFQIRLEETARQINTMVYAANETNSGLFESSFLSKEVIRNLFLTDNIKILSDSTYISGGYKGISFLNTSIDPSTMTADIALTYNVNIPFIPNSLISLPFFQHCKFKLFTGEPLSSEPLADDSLVYLTANASVYHTDKYCSYLNKYSDAVYKDHLQDYILRLGHSLTPCKTCSKIPSYQNTNMFYVTSHGLAYHYSRDCYYLTCHIYNYHYAEIKHQYPQCSRCAANESTNTY